jgi:hypothetical protein
MDFWKNGSQKNDFCAMSSAFLSPIGKCPIDPEGPDEELDADHVHKECKECYKCWGNGKSIQISSKVP